jgi:hypothetical protein
VDRRACEWAVIGEVIRLWSGGRYSDMEFAFCELFWCNTQIFMVIGRTCSTCAGLVAFEFIEQIF